MTIVRVLALVAVVMFCGAFVPVGGCSKGCGKLAGSGGDDLARTGTRYGDDLSISGSRYGAHSDDLARYGGYTPPRPVVVPGTPHVGDDLAHLSSSNLDGAIASLPEAEGAAASIARRPTSSGARLDGVDGTARTFGRDYARNVDDLKLTKKQHDKLMDAFEVVQDITGEVIEHLADDDADAKDARTKLELASMELDARLAETLTPDQHRLFREKLGSPEVVAYRLGREQPVKHAAKRGNRDDKRKTE